MPPTKKEKSRRVSNYSAISSGPGADPSLSSIHNVSEILRQDSMKRKVDANHDLGNPIVLTFDRNCMEFLPGEQITGLVYLKLADLVPFELKKISINVLGTGRVGWEGGVSASQSYIDHNFTVTEHAQKLGPDRLSINFPFSYTLPSAAPLPSSYLNEAYGSISYVMRVTAETDPVLGLTCSESFLVDGLYDLKAEDPLLLAKSELFNRTPMAGPCFGLFSCCNVKGKVEMTIRLPKRGFLPGQRIPFSVEIWNHSRHKVRRMTVRILEHSLFNPPNNLDANASVMTANDIRPFGSVHTYGNGLKKRSKEVWKGYLTLPESLTPSTPAQTPFNQMIRIGYSLQVEIVMAGKNTVNPTAEIPIAIGNLDSVALAELGLDFRSERKKRKTLQSIQLPRLPALPLPKKKSLSQNKSQKGSSQKLAAPPKPNK